ncbi:MAG: histidine kinase [Ignavibacteria bacterium]|nr:histidine kinase [Ignavibacteria bacterium]
MKKRVRDVLLVSSLYDLYLFEEDGRLYELIRNEYLGLHLSHSPEITRVSSALEALSLIKEEKKFDLVITTLHTEDLPPVQFAKKMKENNIKTPVILLSFDNRELTEIILKQDTSVFEKIFIWQGDYRLILGIIKSLEDKLNLENDTRLVGVQSIIVVEDDIRSYSSFLPIIYTEVIKQSQRIITEGINLSHKYLRMRARPKILLCNTYEEAMYYFNEYKEYILGIISDIEYYKDGKRNLDSGFQFAKEVRKKYSDIPILLQSSEPSNEKKAKRLGVSFLLKQSPHFLNELRQFMTQYFGFGDFIFRMPDGTEVGRASDLLSLEQTLNDIPAESIKYHGERNEFSNWLKARTEFWLADKLRPQSVEDFKSIEDLRQHLIISLKEYKKIRARGIITDFNKDTFDPSNSFARIGGGALGGKARGLSFLNILINNYGISNKLPGIQIDVPPAVVIGTDIFDQFMEDNNLKNFALDCKDDHKLKMKFLEAKKFSDEVIAYLVSFLDIVKIPLSVRSSSLLEDSQYHPFAGVYDTYMIPNNDPNPYTRFNDLINSIKLIYASTYSNSAKDYFKITSYRLEEEKMAVIIQRMVGKKHKNRFYPDFSGVAKTYNFYPLPPMVAKDGVISVALGLGKTIVEGGNCVRFCPKYPTRLIQFHNTKETLINNQKSFYALDLETKRENNDPEFIIQEAFTKSYDIHSAEEDGTLHYVGSTYSHENYAIYDGISRVGSRLVTFAPILKNKIFPLPNILELLLDMGSWGMGTPVEIEFAVNLSVPKDQPKEFGVLQMRPFVISQFTEDLNISAIKKEDLICRSTEVLGNGTINNIYDIVYVDVNKFERALSREVAGEVSSFNSKLLNLKRPYVLIGVGRWGTLDPWLGIPVNWSQISGAKTIIEAGMKDMIIEPSQGSHFFQNLTSFMIGYFTVNTNTENTFLDWNWILDRKPADEKKFVKHLIFNKPITIKMNAHQKIGIITKPGVAGNGR